MPLHKNEGLMDLFHLTFIKSDLATFVNLFLFLRILVHRIHKRTVKLTSAICTSVRRLTIRNGRRENARCAGEIK